MWPNSSRRKRHTGKHGGSAIEGVSPTVGQLLADALPSVQAGAAELYSESTVAWLRSEREIALGSADDNHNQAMQLLELEKIERTRVADLDRMLQRLGAEPLPSALVGQREWRPWIAQSEAPTDTQESDEDVTLHGGGHWTPGDERDNLNAYFAVPESAPVGGAA